MKRERHNLTPLTRVNRLWLETRQPGLNYDPTSGEIWGTLKIDALWDPEERKLTTNPRYQKSTLAVHIADEYQVSINLRYPTRWINSQRDDLPSIPNRCPPVFETGERTQKLAVRNGVPLADLHTHPSGECCLGFKTTPPDRNSFDLEAFLEEDLTAWFYRLSYVDRFGLSNAQQNLWEEFDHRAGPGKYLAEVRMVAEALPADNAQCPCKSNLTYAICHKPTVVQARKDHLI